MSEIIQTKRFNEIDLSDSFFESLKSDYPGFEDWFRKKDAEEVLVQYADEGLQAFLYLKDESGLTPEGINPPLPAKKWLKVGTFKIDAHRTRLGERFIKKIMDFAIYGKYESIYVTIFPKQGPLIKMLQKYGFEEQAKKGDELVLVKDLSILKGDILRDYPLMSIKNRRKYILSIYPKYHTRLFPDSILRTEKNVREELIKDVSYTNSIHKIYLCFMPQTAELRHGDLLAIYRTSDGLGPAKYRSVVTSICQVEEIRTKDEFNDVNDFIDYTNSYSIFDPNELRRWFYKPNVVVIRMTYNIALNKRVTRGFLIDEIGISSSLYWGFFQLTDDQFNSILEKGEIDENLIVD
ncbi:N-acetyltransferase [Prevotella corporis]|jgi:prophage protein|uniref:N-acetyltransferase n=1 Tax=Prevotella melaninogenica TaxID=28132 RepID=A0ABX7XR25_9BACT|nr:MULTISPECIES: N-acetyltransferase [Prevotella]MDQ7738082.1 N-acetyltransferase [Prevotella corporis]QUB76056.1 N-acetyltransferase [Prevotella melaninogenica]